MNTFSRAAREEERMLTWLVHACNNVKGGAYADMA